MGWLVLLLLTREPYSTEQQQNCDTGSTRPLLVATNPAAGPAAESGVDDEHTEVECRGGFVPGLLALGVQEGVAG